MKSILFLADDVVELLKGEIFIGFSLIQNMGVVHHLHYLLVVHCFPQLLADSFDFIKIYCPLLLCVVEIEYLVKPLFCPGVP